MVTKNGALLMCNLYWGLLTIQANNFRDINGDLWASTVSASVVHLNEFSTNRGLEVKVGVGDTAPTFNDYCLADTNVGGIDISTLLTITNGTVTFDSMGQMNVTVTVANTSNQNVTIKEIGLFENASNGALKMLIARNVIPAKTLAPSDNVTFTYTVSPFST